MSEKKSSKSDGKKQTAGLTVSMEFPTLPGLSKNHCQAIYEQLCAECQPQNFIEDMWMRDLAWLTTQIDYCRNAIRGYQEYVLHKEVVDINTQLRKGFVDRYILGADINKIRDMDEEHFREPDGSALDDRLFLKFLGSTISAQANTMVVIRQIEDGLLRERDRIYLQFERRRREALKSAILNLETTPPQIIDAGDGY